MDDITKTHLDTGGSALGAQAGGWQDTTRDVVNPADEDDDDLLDTDLVPQADDDGDDLDDDEENSDLADPIAEDETIFDDLSDDDETLPSDPVSPEIGSDRRGWLGEDPMADEDPAEDPADDPDGSAR